MMLKETLSLFCLLPILAQARVWVELQFDKDDPNKEMHTVGKSIEMLNPADVKHFELREIDLREKVGNFFGQRPDELYLNAPTPYGDIFSAFGWKPVSKVLYARQGKVLTVNSGPSIISTQLFQNDGDEKSTFESVIAYPIQNTVSSNWVTESDLVQMDEDIRYSFNINRTSVDGIHEISYMAKYGENYHMTFPATIGSKTSVQISLEPNRKVIAELYANLETMNVQVDYEIALDGYVATNYESTYKSHHFWSFYIYDLMTFSKGKPYVTASEIIMINYYTDPKVVLRDSYTNNILYTIPMKFL